MKITTNLNLLTQLIDSQLGTRCKPVGFSYSDIVKKIMNVFYCGGDCAEDIQSHLGEDLKSIPGNLVPSSDTILRGIKELSTENTSYVVSERTEFTSSAQLKLAYFYDLFENWLTD